MPEIADIELVKRHDLPDGSFVAIVRDGPDRWWTLRSNPDGTTIDDAYTHEKSHVTLDAARADANRAARSNP